MSSDMYLNSNVSSAKGLSSSRVVVDDCCCGDSLTCGLQIVNACVANGFIALERVVARLQDVEADGLR